MQISLDVHRENFTALDVRSGVRVHFSDPSVVKQTPLQDSDIAASPYLASTGAFTSFSLKQRTLRSFQEAGAYERYISSPETFDTNVWDAAASIVEVWDPVADNLPDDEREEREARQDSTVHLSFSYSRLSVEVVAGPASENERPLRALAELLVDVWLRRQRAAEEGDT